MKTVYSTAEVPHIFAANPATAVARNANRTLYCESGVIYSYRHSAPLAAWRGDTLLVNADSYSVTTSKHQSYLARAVHHLPRVHLPDLRAVLEIRFDTTAAEYIAKRATEIADLRDKESRARSEWRKADIARQIAALETACAYVWQSVGKKTPWQSAIAVKEKADKEAAKRRYAVARAQLDTGMERAQRMVEYCRAAMAQDIPEGRTHGLQPWWRLDSVASDIRGIDGMGARMGLGIGATVTFGHAAKLMGKKWAKECEVLALAIAAYADSLAPEIAALRAEYDKQEAIADAENRAAWLAGDDVRRGLRGAIMCRVKGDTVETSHGARVPLTGALMLVALASQCRANGLPMDLKGRAIGPYKGNKIEADGTLIVGCHTITWEAIADAVARHEASK